MQHESCIVPITALAHVGDYLLVGEGQLLRVFRNSELLSTVRVFETQPIHGIVCQKHSTQSNLLLWGGHHLCPVRFHMYPELHVQLGCVIKVQDWLLDVAFQSTAASRQEILEATLINARAAAVTAHNSLLDISITQKEVVDGAHCEDGMLSLLIGEVAAQLESRSILYSAHVQWLENSRILVVAGTAFGEILVWSCITDAEPQKPQLHHVFTGHEGSIFGVRLSPPITVPGFVAPLRVLASCSDDRTIRIWDVTDINDLVSLSGRQPVRDPPQLRETGFGATVHPADGSLNTKPLAIAWGHASRIWGIRFLSPSTVVPSDHVLMSALSYGEDATCQTWRFRRISSEQFTRVGNDDYTFTLKHTSTHTYHSGKNIWSVAALEHPGGSYTVTTGAADGQIITYPATAEGQDMSRGDFLHVEHSMDDISRILDQPFFDGTYTPSSVLDAGRPYYVMEHSTSFRSYASLGKDSFLAITNTGVVLLVKHAKVADNESSVMHSKPLQWKMINQPLGLQGYSVATAAKGQDSATAFFAGSNGIVYCYNQQYAGTLVVARARGKIAAIFAQISESEDSFETGTPQQTFSLLITLVGSSTAHQYIVAMLPGGEVSLRRSIPISLPSGFTVTSFVNPTFVDGEEHTFLGGRNGSVAIFSISSRLDPDVNGSTLRATHIRTLEQIHAKETVTAMLWIPVTSADHTSFGWLLTVGRDGSCAMSNLSRDEAEASLVHKLSFPFGPNIEGVYLDRTSNDLIVYGFSGKHFVLYNASLEREIWTVECGGAHRVWAFQPVHEPEDPSIQGGTFVWTKAGKMNVFSKHTPSHQVIRLGGHGREIKALAVSPPRGACGRLIATGAEDTDIRLFRYETSSQDFRCLRVLRKHVTGIQHLQWSHDGSFLFSSGGFEEFFVWRVRTVPVLGVGVVCEAVCPPESELADLRITHFTARSIHASNDEGRETYAFVVGMVYSDSTVRVYRYTCSATSKRWTLLLTGNYLTSCLTQSTFLTLGSENTLLTAGTDGHLALWPLPSRLFRDQIYLETTESFPSKGSLPDTIKWHTRTKIHQSTIKALAQHQLSPGSVLVVTGGDDNALAFTLLYRNRSVEEPKMQTSTLLIPRAHASAVTALALIPEKASLRIGGTETRFTVVSSSNDQRAKVWEIVVSNAVTSVDGIQIKRVANVPTAVADVSSLDILEDGNKVDSSAGRRIIVCGVGMDIWRFSPHEIRGKVHQLRPYSLEIF